MLRRANDDETAAFLLVERTVQRVRPLVGTRGLEAVNVPDGMIERGPLGRLRFRFDGKASDFEPENGRATRPLSERESSWWDALHRMVTVAKPVADSEWNLLSMRIGPRLLRRLPLGSVVTFVPDGTPPFRGSLDVSLPEATPQLDVALPTEASLLRALDAFLNEDESSVAGRSPMGAPWRPVPSADGRGHTGVSSPLFRTRGRTRGRWPKCPLCHAPVVKGAFNPRIPFGNLRPGSGAIRDLRGGYLSRLRETYLLAEPEGLLETLQRP